MSLPKITKIKHTVEPTWDSKTGRNSNSGKFGGTFVGYFDTLEISVGKTTQNELKYQQLKMQNSQIQKLVKINPKIFMEQLQVLK